MYGLGKLHVEVCQNKSTKYRRLILSFEEIFIIHLLRNKFNTKNKVIKNESRLIYSLQIDGHVCYLR